MHTLIASRAGRGRGGGFRELSTLTSNVVARIRICSSIEGFCVLFMLAKEPMFLKNI